MTNKKNITAFIPGTITKVLVKIGDKVEKGDNLLILDAMKMNNRIKASEDGIIKKINTQEGDVVGKNKVLIELE